MTIIWSFTLVDWISSYRTSTSNETGLFSRFLLFIYFLRHYWNISF